MNHTDNRENLSNGKKESQSSKSSASISRPTTPTFSKLTDDDFEICEMIGTGVSSCVYRAIHKETGRVVALKKINWGIGPERTAKEIKWMMKLSHPHICRLVTLYRIDDAVTLVLEYIPHLHHRFLQPKLRGRILKHYIFQLMLAIEYLHRNKVIHHDIKPGNFLFDPETCHGSLIDYGLCEHDASLNVGLSAIDDYKKMIKPVPNEFINPRMYINRPKLRGTHGGTRGYIAPEILMRAWNQTPKVDVWSAGVILLSILTDRYSFFSQEKDCVALCEIAALLGEERLMDCAIETQRRIKFPCPYPDSHSLKEVCYGCNAKLVEEPVDEKIWDLLEGMLEPIPTRRYSSKMVIDHPYFDDIRGEYGYCLDLSGNKQK